MEISDVYDFYSVCLLDQDGCQILIVLQDAAGSKKDSAGVYFQGDGQQLKPVTFNNYQVTPPGSADRHL